MPTHTMPTQTLYKLTDRDGYTRRGQPNETLWSVGIVVTATAPGIEINTSQVIHAYTNQLLAVLLNPVHSNTPNPLLWECSGEVANNEYGLIVGVKQLLCIKQIELPVISTSQKSAFALLCATEVYRNPSFIVWANAWLNGTDRSRATAASKRATLAIEASAAWSAEAAAGAAGAAAFLIAGGAPAGAVETLAFRAAEAATKAAQTIPPLDLIALAHRAMEY